MPFDDRDPKFERVLAQHLRGDPAKANCPDAETLAAYHERNLSLDEMARWKEHISACEACQQALALVETTENQLAEDWDPRKVPVMEAALILKAQAGSISKLSAKAEASGVAQSAASPIATLRRKPALLRWAIPLGAVAAGVLVFIGIYEQRAAKMAPASETVVARRQEPATPGPMLDQSHTKVQPQAEPKEERLETSEMSGQKTELEPSAGLRVKPKVEAQEMDEERRASRDQLAGGRLEKKKLSPPAPAPRIPAQAAKDATIHENAPMVSASPRTAPAPMANGGVVGGMGGGVAAQRAPSHADAKSVPSAATQTVTVESAAPPIDTTASAMMMKQGVSNELVEVTAASSGVILTPDNRVFWKLQPAGTVQLTTDGGKDWKRLETGANADLTAGFAPSSKVCWIAGKAGTLLLTKDRGNHWTRISTPIVGDLGGVHAADAKHASIWDATRHTSYETSDGGSTWKQTTNQ